MGVHVARTIEHITGSFSLDGTARTHIGPIKIPGHSGTVVVPTPMVCRENCVCIVVVTTLSVAMVLAVLTIEFTDPSPRPALFSSRAVYVATMGGPTASSYASYAWVPILNSSGLSAPNSSVGE